MEPCTSTSYWSSRANSTRSPTLTVRTCAPVPSTSPQTRRLATSAVAGMTIPAPLRRSPAESGFTRTRSCSISISSLASCIGPMLRAGAGMHLTGPKMRKPRGAVRSGVRQRRGAVPGIGHRAPAVTPGRDMGRFHPSGAAKSRLCEQVPAEVGHGERDLPALRGEDQPLLQQAVTGGGERRGPATEMVGDPGRADGLVPALGELGHRAQVLSLGRRGPLVPGPEKPDGELAFGLWRGQLDVGRADRTARSGVPGSLP